MLDLILSCVGVVLFSVLTAYDTYMIKQYALRMEFADSQEYAKVGLFGAFQLYLDFINLFLSLLNLTGKRRQ
jgi:FtsH-binding integral membrane protein